MHSITFIHEERTWFGWKRKELFERYLPANWEEMDDAFFCLIAKHFFGGTKSDDFVIEWAKLPKKVANGLKRYVVLDIIALISPLFERPVSNTVFIHEIKIKQNDKVLLFEKIVGSMSDMSFAQFADADAFVRAYSETKDEKNLRGLAAVLYRENSRDKYDSRFVEYRMEMMRYANTDELKAIHLNFICLLNWLADTYPLLYTKPSLMNGDEIEFTQEPSSPPDYINLVHKLAGPKLGTVDQVEQMPMGYVFWLLCKKD